jgi:branched-subunit amino acid aminotransferase/4-amino-4-deoxychorismate lyase
MNQPLRVWVDGLEAANVPATDRGLHYGDGVFRTLRVAQGRPCEWPRQLDKLRADAAGIGLAACSVRPQPWRRRWGRSAPALPRQC